MEQQLRAYLDHIGFAGEPRPDAATLAALVHAHRIRISFENLDISLGRGISLDPGALFDKLVTRGRGGYCFEQNALFGAMLRAIGFDARQVLGRVWLLSEGVPPRTHTLNIVMLDGATVIADVGFGGSYLKPMPLVADMVTETEDGARHRLVRDADHGWMLERDGGSGWMRQYSFTTDAVWPEDLEMGNHYTATRPDTRFTSLVIASRARADGYDSLVDKVLTTSRMGVPQVEEIADADRYRAVLAERFDLALSAEEVARLGLFRDA